MKAKLLSVAAGTVLAISATSASAAVLTFQGGAQGCFGISGAACVASVAPAADGGLSYVGGTLTFQQNTNASGFAAIGGGALANFGTLTLATNPRDYQLNGDVFRLLVNFTMPSDTGVGSFTANLLGSLVNLADGGVAVQWQNPVQNFTSATYGNFTLTLQGTSLSGRSGFTQDITGFIQASVPEPATWGMMLLGFAGIGFAMRRGRKPVLAQVA